MEFRGAHGTALLIESYAALCDEAAKVGARNDTLATAAIAAFVDQNLKAFVARFKRVKSTWRATETDDLPESGRDQFVAVNQAVEAVYDAMNDALVQFAGQMRTGRESGSVEQQLAALQSLGASRETVTALAQPLAAAVGSDSTEADELSADMRLERSKYMALAAQLSNLKGVWKVGNGHVSDVTEGRVNVDTSRTNIVSRETFNKEFDAWKRWKEGREKKAQREQARQGRVQQAPSQAQQEQPQ
jgi:hypothetical protein